MSALFQKIIALFVALFNLFTIPAQQAIRGRKLDLPETPVDFVPTIRLIAFTDTHNQNENPVDAVDTAYALFDDDPVYAGIDGIFGLGDFSSIGTEPDYSNYYNTVKAHVREETPFINILGNHEMKNKDEYYDLFVNTFGHEPDTVTEINGFSCIAFSGERGLTEWTFNPDSLKWLSDEIYKAEEKADGKAVFVFQHPHPWGTVYGSTIWGNEQINVVLDGHSCVVDFSGHSHFPSNDPRSINQTTYTAFGCGAMARFELDKNFIWGQHPEGYEDAAQMCVIEADDDGSVRIRSYDLLSDTYICEYYIDDVNDTKNYTYTYKNMRMHDARPVFADDTKASAHVDETGEWLLTFDEADTPDGFIVHEYHISIFDSKGLIVYSKDLLDDYYLANGLDTARFHIGTDTLKSGEKYTMFVTAESAYYKYSDTVKLTFIAE